MNNSSLWSGLLEIVNSSTQRICRSRRDHYRHEGDEDGVIVLTCERPEAGITFGGLAVVVAAFLVFKGVIIGHLGPDVHAAAIDTLRHGSLVERAGAFLMWPDAVSLAVAAEFGPLLR